jgi:NAD-dependent SIR2 family protein deacetylase
MSHYGVMFKNQTRYGNFSVQKFLADANFDPQPNDAHKAIVQLENAGLVTGIITQNVDELHQKAGSKNVIEMHGTLSRTKCTYCQIDCGPCNNFLDRKYLPVCPCHGDETTSSQANI